MTNIAINGFGRIGRLILRALIENEIKDINIKAINSPAPITQYAHLLKYDSVHSEANFDISYDAENLIINNKAIKFSHYKNLAELNWQKNNIDIILECSGKFNNKEAAAQHIKQGAKKVIVSAPCKNADKTIIYGVNHNELNLRDEVISIGSCTTNALAPFIKIIDDNLKITEAFATTIHAYTGDQRLVDNSHNDLRRARAAACSMIPTKTGAAKAIELVLPHLKNKIHGAAIRVPVPNVSLIDLKVKVKQSITEAEFNQLINSSIANYSNIIDIAKAPLVSCDFNHSSFSGIYDPYETHIINKNFIRLLIWYDNEWGFANRMLDILKLNNLYA